MAQCFPTQSSQSLASIRGPGEENGFERDWNPPQPFDYAVLLMYHQSYQALLGAGRLRVRTIPWEVNDS